MLAPHAAQPLARRYRPRAFDGPAGLVGQPHVTRTLKNAIRSGKIANAYLLTGPRGTGKTTTARVLAAALNCPHRTDDLEPCGTCGVCTAIVGGKESPDVVEIDAATNRGADDARELRQRAQYAPSTERAYKVYIVDEAHMLTREAWNALLKVLEEPPARVLFVFCTTEPQKIEQVAEPVLSRCQRLDMRRITVADLVGALSSIATTEALAIDQDALTLVARRADGGMRDALSTLDQLVAFAGAERITAETVRESFGMQSETVFLNTIDRLLEGKRDSLFKLVRYLDDQGADLVRFLDDLQEVFGALALAQEGGVPDGWSAKGLAGLMKRAGRVAENGQWVAGGTVAISTTALIDCMRAAQEDAVLLRQAPRASTVLVTTLQRAVTRLQAAKASPAPAAV